ncbi:MAG: phosphomethylpyrimidine synthase ThiC, partial [Phascolarctobacterium sp.]|nr:phosphomethylpyrimidine synthase ThiC [Phascolarctobacterium sp.]
MTTQMQFAKQGVVTKEMEFVAREENLNPEFIREGVANGTIAICCNVNHKNLKPCGVGAGLRVKVNANIGTSDKFPELAPELGKLHATIST